VRRRAACARGEQNRILQELRDGRLDDGAVRLDEEGPDSRFIEHFERVEERELLL